MFANKYQKYSTLKTILLSIKNNFILVISLFAMLFGLVLLASNSLSGTQSNVYSSQGILNNSVHPFSSMIYSYVEGTVKDSSFLEKEAEKLSQNNLKHQNNTLYTVEELTSCFSFPAYNAGSVLYSYKITFTNYDSSTMLDVFNFLLDDIVEELKNKYPQSFEKLSVSQYGSYPISNKPESSNYTGIFAIASLIISLLVFIVGDYYIDAINDEHELNELGFTSIKLNMISGNKLLKELLPFIFYSKKRVKNERNLFINDLERRKIMNILISLKKVVIVPIDENASINVFISLIKKIPSINLSNFDRPNFYMHGEEEENTVYIINDIYSFTLSTEYLKKLADFKVLFISTKRVTKKANIYNAAKHLKSCGFNDCETSIFIT